MTSAVSGVGSYFFVADSSGDFAAVQECLSISCPSMSSETIDVTSLDSTSGYKETIGGFLDAGEVQVEMNWIKGTGQTRIRDYLSSKTSAAYKIFVNAGGAWSFNGIVTGWNLTFGADEAIKASATIKVTGAATWVSANNRNLLIIGDSYAQRTTSPTDPWYAQYLNYANTITNVGIGGAKLATGGSPIKDEVAGYLATYDAGTVIINGGSNDIKGPLSAPPDTEAVKSAMAEIIDAVLSAGRECITLDIPPLGGYAFLNADISSPSYGTEKLAAITEYNSWLAAYSVAVGARHVSIFDILDDSGSIAAAYDLGDGLHANVAGCQAMAAAIDLALVKDDAVAHDANAPVALRGLPEPENLATADITAVQSLINAVGDEWDSVIECWWFKTASLANAYAGLKGTYTATVAAGTPSVEGDGMLLEAGEYLDLGFDQDDIPLNHSVGFMFGAVTTTASNLYAYGGGDNFGSINSPITSSLDFRQHASQGFKVRGHSNGSYTIASKDFSDAVDQVVESRAVSGANLYLEVYENGTLIGTSPTVAVDQRTSRDVYLNANNLDSGVDSGNSAHWVCFFITDGTTTPSTWNTAVKGAA